jgi:hypothetical protein
VPFSIRVLVVRVLANLLQYWHPPGSVSASLSDSNVSVSLIHAYGVHPCVVFFLLLFLLAWEFPSLWRQCMWLCLQGVAEVWRVPEPWCRWLSRVLVLWGLYGLVIILFCKAVDDIEGISLGPAVLMWVSATSEVQTCDWVSSKRIGIANNASVRLDLFVEMNGWWWLTAVCYGSRGTIHLHKFPGWLSPLLSFTSSSLPLFLFINFQLVSTSY